MPTQVQFRRGTTVQNNNFTGAAGELSFDTQVKTIRVHDGSVAGGTILAKSSDLTTANVSEVSNLYFSNARARSALSAGDGTIVYDPTTGQIRATANITATIENTVNNLSTSDVSEGANLYFTTARVFSAVTGNLALKANLTDKLNVFASTSSSELASVISDETGTGNLVFSISPSFTGTPLSTTATAGTNTTQIATTAYVRTEVSNLINSAPSALDTLNELAAAINNDNNFATTIVTQIGTKANITSKLSVFASTSSSELASVISDETGTGNLVFSISPSFTGTVNVVELAATGNVTSPFFYSQSDINLKKDIEPIVDALDIVKQLSGYSFKWKHNEAKSFGLIAQYVEHILPMLIGTTPDGSKTVLYNGIIALLLEAIKAQQVQIDEIKAKLDE